MLFFLNLRSITFLFNINTTKTQNKQSITAQVATTEIIIIPIPPIVAATVLSSSVLLTATELVMFSKYARNTARCYSESESEVLSFKSSIKV